MKKPVLRAEISEAGYRNGFKIKNVKLEIYPGEILLITGRSGSGKTTLLKTLLGIIHLSNGYYQGRITILGEEINKIPPSKLYREVAYIPQEPWYGVIGYTVETEYCLALSQAGLRCNPLNLKKYGLMDKNNRTTYTLSAGEYQRLLWAITIDRNVKLLIMDEPFVYIDKEGREQVFKLVREYLESNGCIIVVDHEYYRWKDLKPRTLLLENGYTKYYGVYSEEKLSILLGEKNKVVTTAKSTRKEKHEAVIKVRNLWFNYPRMKPLLRNINIEINKEEIIGITGPNGSGKTTFLKIIAGIYKPRKGIVEIHGKVIYVPEEPLLYYTHPTPREELESSGASRGLIDKYVKELGLDKVIDKPLRMLSTGERRRVAILSALLRKYDVFLLDEPSGGLDNYNVWKIAELIKLIAKSGRAVVIATHDERLMNIFDKVYLLERGVLRRVY